MKPRVLAFRPRERVNESHAQAEEVGVVLKVIPLVATEAHRGAPIQGLLEALAHGHVDFAVFSSPTAFQHLLQAAPVNPKEVRGLLSRPRVVAIGLRTSQELRDFGLEPELPEDFSSLGLATYLQAQGIQRKAVVLLRSSRGSPDLVRDLRAEGAEVRDIPLYDLHPLTDEGTRQELKHALLGGRFQAYAFTSSLTVEAFFRIFQGDGTIPVVQRELRQKVVGAIGRPTAATLAQWGVEVVRPANASFRDLLNLLRERIGEKGL